MNSNVKRIAIAFSALAVISASAIGIVAAQGRQGDAPAHMGMFRQNRPFLGVTLEDVEGGVRVVSVVEGSPAETAGIQVDDVIVSINGTNTEDSQAVREAILALSIGDTVTIEVQRGEETVSLEVTLGEYLLEDRPGLFMDSREVAVTYNPEDQTWTVRRLSEDSALYEAGLRADDVITAIDGEAYDPAGIGEYLDGLADDATVTLSVTRGEESLELVVPADALDLVRVPFFGRFNFGPGGFDPRDFGHGMFNMPFDLGRMGGFGRLGLVFTPIDADVAAENDLSVTEGALVAEVLEDSPAAEAGLLEGDVITSVNGEAITQEITLRDRLTAYEPGDTVTLDVLRDGETVQLTVTLGEPDTFFQFMPGGLFGQGMLPEGLFGEGFFGGRGSGQPNQGGANL